MAAGFGWELGKSLGCGLGRITQVGCSPAGESQVVEIVFYPIKESGRLILVQIHFHSFVKT